MLKPGASSSLGSNARNSLIVNFSNCCRVCDFGDILLFAAADGSGDVVGILPSSSSIDSASDDLDVGKTAKAVQGAVILLPLLLIILAVAANDIGGNDNKGDKASTTTSVVVVLKSSNDENKKKRSQTTLELLGVVIAAAMDEALLLNRACRQRWPSFIV